MARRTGTTEGKAAAAGEGAQSEESREVTHYPPLEGPGGTPAVGEIVLYWHDRKVPLPGIVTCAYPDGVADLSVLGSPIVLGAQILFRGRIERSTSAEPERNTWTPRPGR